MVLDVISTHMNVSNIYCFTDSTIALAWRIRSTDKEYKTFVQNRVIQIRSLVNVNNWFYCRTIENPADHSNIM